MRQIKWVSGIATEMTQNNWNQSPETAESARKMAGLKKRKLKTRETGGRRIKKDSFKKEKEKRRRRGRGL